MSRGRRATALSRLRPGLLLMLACAAWVFPTRAVAQSISITFAPRDRTDSISPAPVINIATTQISPDALPATITLEASLEPQFRSPFLVRSTSELQAQFNVDSLLPQHTRVFFRARVIDRKGTIIAEQVTTGGVPVRSWLRLVSPIRTTEVLFTETPTFIWSSPAITLPPGPWTFTLRIINRAQNSTTEFAFSDTTGVPRVPLNACTSYRWEVLARAINGGPNDQIVASSPGSFVIQTPDCPLSTILYQNFPNPFGRGEKLSTTCFWFDLAKTSTVKLAIYDLRLRRVREIVPGALGARLDPGAYGRQSITDTGSSGCDPRLMWDGKDATGRPVPPGVYLAVFEADGVRSTEKILYKGP
ncbi:MAG TPA: hypothetical protein VGM50_03505 [Gemmatimonadaceae bacterium]